VSDAQKELKIKDEKRSTGKRLMLLLKPIK